MTYSILLVEDDPAIATTLRYSLEREGWQVFYADTVQQTLHILPTLVKLSAIIMDVSLPDGDGFHLCQQVRFGQYFSQVPILFLTARNDEIDKIIGLEMGADDYITKPFSPRELIARIKAILRREEVYKSQQTEEKKFNICPDFHKNLPSGSWHYQDNIYQLLWNNVPIPLSKTELSIMLALLSQPTHILSREQILSQVSDYPEHRLVRTIDSHIKTLRQKLVEINPDCEVIITHRGLGYSLKQ